jgi:hypothetical protein
MSGKWVILIATNVLAWLIYFVCTAMTETALSYGYVPVGFTAGCLITLLAVGRVALAANMVAWAFTIFVVVGRPGNVLVPVTVYSVIAFSLGSAIITVSGYSQ